MSAVTLTSAKLTRMEYFGIVCVQHRILGVNTQHCVGCHRDREQRALSAVLRSCILALKICCRNWSRMDSTSCHQWRKPMSCLCQHPSHLQLNQHNLTFSATFGRLVTAFPKAGLQSETGNFPGQKIPTEKKN